MIGSDSPSTLRCSCSIRVNRKAVGGRVAIAYVTDRNYHDLTLLSLASVASHHRTASDFFLFQDEYSIDLPVEYRRALEAKGHTLTVLQAPAFSSLYAVSGAEHISRTAYLRVTAIEQLARYFDYVLYLDGDTLAFGDLRSQELAGFPETGAACLDLSIATGFDDPTFPTNCRTNGRSPLYFNSGVLMINSRRWLETRALDRFTENLQLHAESCPYMSHCKPNDQCALNLTLGTDYRRLPVTYNVQKSAFHTRAWANALVRHYTGPVKFLPIRPWRCDWREYRLLMTISAEVKLPNPSGYFDFGISYALNALRRHRTIARYESALEAIGP